MTPRGRLGSTPAAMETQPVAASGGHVPVLAAEVLAWLAPRPGDVVLDATLGQGGHAEALAEAIGARGRLLGVDRDPAAIAAASARLARFGASFRAAHGDHRNLRELAQAAGFAEVDRVLFDLGISSAQLDDPERGFAFAADGPLDMRMDPTRGRSAAELLASLPEGELASILWRHGEERNSRRLARAIVRERASRPLARTSDLARICERVAGPAARRFRIHPATRSFMALRIAVNDELAALSEGLAAACTLLRPGGRLVVIAFHSLEDRIVKHGFRALAHPCVCPPDLPVCGCGRKPVLRVLTRHPVRPSAEEISRNARARSARLRAAEKL